jgi:hypothetical protein
MRMVLAVSLAVALGLPSRAGGVAAQVSEPFVAVGVWYPGGSLSGLPGASPGAGGSSADRDEWRRDLPAIRAAGFNSVRTAVDWTTVEPERGQYRFTELNDFLSLADEAGLRVIVQIDAAAAPGWVATRYPDSAVIPEPGTPALAAGGYCVDHPGVRADLGAFIGATAAAAAGHRAFYAIDVWRNPAASPAGTAAFCYCPYTQTRFRDVLKRKYGSLAALNAAWRRSSPWSSWSDVRAPRDQGRTSTDVLDWRRFFEVKLQEDLKFRADASAPRAARPVTSHSGDRPGSGDPWLMAAAVDHYGTSVGGTMEPVRRMASLDAMRSAARGRGWWVGALQAGEATTGAELRLWTWAAISRGARAISIDDWRGLNRGAPADGAVPDRVRAAGEAAGVIGRNGSLFGPLRPHTARMAILRPPALRGTELSGAATPESDGAPLDVYRAFFDRNIQVDFVHPDEIAGGIASRYDAIDAGDRAALSISVVAALKGFVREGGTLIAEDVAASKPLPRRGADRSLDEVFASGKPWAGLRTPAPGAAAARDRRGEASVTLSTYGHGRAFLFRHPAARVAEKDDDRKAAESLARVVAAGIKPEVGIEGGAGVVEARFLESADAILLVAMNHGAAPQKVTFAFGPDVPEAIWQNMETGAAVNFVQTADGPTYTRTFGGRDVMVLVRGKRLR